MNDAEITKQLLDYCQKNVDVYLQWIKEDQFGPNNPYGYTRPKNTDQAIDGFLAVCDVGKSIY